MFSEYIKNFTIYNPIYTGCEFLFSNGITNIQINDNENDVDEYMPDEILCDIKIEEVDDLSDISLSSTASRFDEILHTIRKSPTEGWVEESLKEIAEMIVVNERLIVEPLMDEWSGNEYFDKMNGVINGLLASSLGKINDIKVES